MLRVALSFVFEWPEQINHLFLRCPNHTKLALISGNPVTPFPPQKSMNVKHRKRMDKNLLEHAGRPTHTAQTIATCAEPAGKQTHSHLSYGGTHACMPASTCIIH